MNYNQLNHQNQQMKKMLTGIFIAIVICIVIYGFYVFPVISKKYYAVIFKLNNGSENVVVEVQKNKMVSKIEDPSMNNYVFVGWALEDEFYNFNTAVKSNIILEAIWYTEEELEEIIISSGNNSSGSGSNGSNNGSGSSGSSGENSGSNSSGATGGNSGSSSSGSTGGNSSSNGSNSNGGSSDFVIPDNVVVPIVRYQVTFDSNGGSSVDSIKVIRNGLVEKPKNPTKSGYRFLGWTLNGIYYDFSSKVVNDIKLVAVWEKLADPIPTSTTKPSPSPSVSPSPSPSVSPSPSPSVSPSPSPTASAGNKNLSVSLAQKSQTPSGNWAKERVIKVTYTSKNAKSPVYYIKSTVDTTLSSGTISGVCGTGNNPSSCKSSSTTKVVANTWYKVKTSTAEFSYTKNAVLYARIADSTGDYKQAKLDIVNIDSSKPSTPNVKYNSGENAHKWQNNYNITLSSSANSGISSYEIDNNGDGKADSKLSNGSYIPNNNTDSCKVRFRAVSNTGIVSDWTGVHHIHMDNEPPSKTYVNTGTYVKGTVTSSEKVDRTFSATDNVGVAYYQWSDANCTKWAGNEQTKLDSDGIRRPVTYVPLYGSQYNQACHRAVDYAGNVGPWSDVTIVNISTTYQKKVAFFGDSITYGIGCCYQNCNQDETNQDCCLSWADCIGCDRDYNAYQYGHPGWTLSKLNSDWNKLIPSVLEAHKNEYYDFIILQGGINDISNKVSLSNFEAGLRSYLSIATTNEKWKNSRIGYIFTYQIPRYEGGLANNRYNMYYSSMIKILKEYNVPYLDLAQGTDLYLGSGKTFSDILLVGDAKYLYDGLHLTCDGDMVLAKYVQAWMRTLPKYSR